MFNSCDIDMMSHITEVNNIYLSGWDIYHFNTRANSLNGSCTMYIVIFLYAIEDIIQSTQIQHEAYL
jgi:hypothetical protein